MNCIMRRSRPFEMLGLKPNPIGLSLGNESNCQGRRDCEGAKRLRRGEEIAGPDNSLKGVMIGHGFEFAVFEVTERIFAVLSSNKKMLSEGLERGRRVTIRAYPNAGHLSDPSFISTITEFFLCLAVTVSLSLAPSLVSHRLPSTVSRLQPAPCE